MFWIAKARRDYICDVCKRKILKGEKRVLYGEKALCYTMIDRTICMQCFQTKSIDEIIREGFFWGNREMIIREYMEFLSSYEEGD